MRNSFIKKARLEREESEQEAAIGGHLAGAAVRASVTGGECSGIDRPITASISPTANLLMTPLPSDNSMKGGPRCFALPGGPW